jgi:hypothetical protein
MHDAKNWPFRSEQGIFKLAPLSPVLWHLQVFKQASDGTLAIAWPNNTSRSGAFPERARKRFKLVY